MVDNWYTFPAMAGIQARSTFFVILVPLRVVPKLFCVDDHHLPIHQRSQRMLNKARVPQISKYLVENPDDYILTSLCASVHGEVKFEAVEGYADMGRLNIAMGSKLYLNDGQHRAAAIEQALKDRPFLGDENISIVLYVDHGHKRSQQIFADLNMNPVKPPTSIQQIFNHRNKSTAFTKTVVEQVDFFNNHTEFERANIAVSSPAVFTFSALHKAQQILFGKLGTGEDDKEKIAQACEFWNAVIAEFQDWQYVMAGKAQASDLRANTVHAHGVMLHAIATVGHILFELDLDWKQHIKTLSTIDWSRENPHWRKRVLSFGKINKGRINSDLAANYILKEMGVELPPRLAKIEDDNIYEFS